MGIKKWFSGDSDFKKQMRPYQIWDDIVETARAEEMQRDLTDKYGEFPLKFSILSDSAVISVDINCPDAFARLILYSGLFICSLFTGIDNPLMTRGAIAIGNIYQKDNMIFGPALIDAAVKESCNL